MTRVCALAMALLLLASSAALAAPAAMTRDEIIAMAQSGVGYSYWWGHGRWRTDGAQHGSCSGSCPGCTHSGSYGADCSGFAAKVWQVPSPSPVTTDAHPYSTSNFRWEQTHWDRIDRDNTTRGDCMVYRNDANTGGHIVVYESGDPWGSSMVYEAKGCSYGIRRNTKSMGSTYVTIRRHNLSSGVTTGKIQGVVYVEHGDGDMTDRLPGATVGVQGGPTATARADDAYWSFTLEAGSYTISASLPGYTSASRSCSVAAGDDGWCSIGLVAACAPSCGGKACGPDGCGGSCGACAEHHACSAQGQCECQPACDGLACGPDPFCGTSCGLCAEGEACRDGACVCQPACDGRRCGPDGCGGSCGACAPGQTCEADGQCRVAGCVLACAERECGPDTACGLSCGLCTSDRACDLDGRCQALLPDQAKLYGYVLEAEEGAELDPDALPHLGGASVWSEGGPTVTADENGYYEAVVAPGPTSLSAFANGHLEGRAECEALAGAGNACHLGLAFDPEAEPRDPDPDPDGIAGGCATGGAAGGAGSILPLLGLGLLLARRRRVV